MLATLATRFLFLQLKYESWKIDRQDFIFERSLKLGPWRPRIVVVSDKRILFIRAVSRDPELFEIYLLLVAFRGFLRKVDASNDLKFEIRFCLTWSSQMSTWEKS